MWTRTKRSDATTNNVQSIRWQDYVWQTCYRAVCERMSKELSANTSENAPLLPTWRLSRKTIQSGEWHTLVKVVVVDFQVVGRSTSRAQRNERESKFEVYSDNNCRVERCSKHRGIGVQLFEEFARRRNAGTRINRARQILTTISSPQLDSLTAGENKSR